jgi:hypothetical protein
MRGPEVPDRAYLVTCEFRAAVAFALRPLHAVVATICPHVFVVVIARTQEQMRRVYTSWIITSMTNAHVVWNLAEVDLPRYAMGGTYAALSSFVNNAVTEPIASACPIPTRLCSPNKAPKPLLKRDPSVFSGHNGASVATFTLKENT